MALFRKKVKEDEKNMTTLEQILKAYKDLSDDDKKNFKESIDDRIDESVGEQEHLDGDKDSQSAKDRIDEAIGTEDADKKADDKSHDESGDGGEEKHDDVTEPQSASESEALKALREDVAKLTARLDLIERTPQKADDDIASKLSALENRYQN